MVKIPISGIIPFSQAFFQDNHGVFFGNLSGLTCFSCGFQVGFQDNFRIQIWVSLGWPRDSFFFSKLEFNGFMWT